MKLTEVSTNSQDIFPFPAPLGTGWGGGGCPSGPIYLLLIGVWRREVNWIAFVRRPSATLTEGHTRILYARMCVLNVLMFLRLCSSICGMCVTLSACLRVSIWAAMTHWGVRLGSV